MKNKLIELIQDATDEFAEEGWKHFECVGTPPFSYVPTIYRSEFIADHLIANGVTIQRWIPVEERLPKRKTIYLVHYKHAYSDVDGYWAMGTTFFDGIQFNVGYAYKVTHWMPLPEPLKENE